MFMVIPDKINFLQMGRYGNFSEQTYRNNFEHDDFNWNSALWIANNMQEFRIVNQLTLENWLFILMHHWQLSIWRKQHAKN